MDHPSKTVEVNNFQLETGDPFDDADYDARKSTSADKRDMARMGKPQEMKVETKTKAASPC